MACGEITNVLETYLTTCSYKVTYPCGFKFCSTTIKIPYPCGIKWCSGLFGIPYPCGIKICYSSIKIKYICGFKWCNFSIPYLCFKRRNVSKYCYDFHSVEGTCYVVVDDLYGCCENKEYNWKEACFFVTYGSGGIRPGTVGSSASYYRKCFDKSLKPIGPCTRGNSLTDIGDQPSAAVDPGSVAAQPKNQSQYSLQKKQHWMYKFGRCNKCIVTSIIIAIIAWSLLLIQDLVNISHLNGILIYFLAALLSLPFLGHVIGLLGRIGFVTRKPKYLHNVNNSRGCQNC